MHDLPKPQVCRADESGAAHRALSPKRLEYFAQSSGVMFGLLPEKLADLRALAAAIHADRELCA